MFFLIVAAFIVGVLITYSLCVAAGREDRLREELEEKESFYD